MQRNPHSLQAAHITKHNVYSIVCTTPEMCRTKPARSSSAFGQKLYTLHPNSHCSQPDSATPVAEALHVTCATESRLITHALTDVLTAPTTRLKRKVGLATFSLPSSWYGAHDVGTIWFFFYLPFLYIHFLFHILNVAVRVTCRTAGRCIPGMAASRKCASLVRS